MVSGLDKIEPEANLEPQAFWRHLTTNKKRANMQHVFYGQTIQCYFRGLKS